jgi:hypothetical protein
MILNKIMQAMQIYFCEQFYPTGTQFVTSDLKGMTGTLARSFQSYVLLLTRKFNPTVKSPTLGVTEWSTVYYILEARRRGTITVLLPLHKATLWIMEQPQFFIYDRHHPLAALKGLVERKSIP